MTKAKASSHLYCVCANLPAVTYTVYALTSLLDPVLHYGRPTYLLNPVLHYGRPTPVLHYGRPTYLRPTACYCQVMGVMQRLLKKSKFRVDGARRQPQHAQGGAAGAGGRRPRPCSKAKPVDAMEGAPGGAGASGAGAENGPAPLRKRKVHPPPRLVAEEAVASVPVKKRRTPARPALDAASIKAMAMQIAMEAMVAAGGQPGGTGAGAAGGAHAWPSEEGDEEVEEEEEEEEEEEDGGGEVQGAEARAHLASMAAQIAMEVAAGIAPAKAGEAERKPKPPTQVSP